MGALSQGPVKAPTEGEGGCVVACVRHGYGYGYGYSIRYSSQDSIRYSSQDSTGTGPVQV